MSYSELLDAYAKEVAGWLDQSKKVVSAVQRLQKAVTNGNVRDLEKLARSARNVQESARRAPLH